MKDCLLLLFGFLSGVVVTIAFGHKALTFLVTSIEKFAAKTEGR